VLPLGSGAFGEVHLAWDNVDGRWVALKRFTGQDELGLLRMVIESRIRVSHPNLVKTLAFRLVDDRAWLVTELARGGSLRGLVARTGALPWGWVVEAVDQILAALTALHATGVVHRDLKPANLLLGSVGARPPHLLVGDFGIATWRTVSMTGIGAAIGTPGYLAPEYLDGQQPSPATDLFAVGVLAAELLAGRRLVHYSNASPTMPSSWNAELPVPAEVPASVAAVLRRMAAPDPAWRYADCTQAREALLAASPPTTRGDLTVVAVPDLLASMPPGWTPEGPEQPTTVLPTAKPQTLPEQEPLSERQAPSEQQGLSEQHGLPEQESLPAPENPQEPEAAEPVNLVGLPIDGGPTALVLETPPTERESGSSTSPPSGSATSLITSPSGSSTHPPSDSATSPTTPPTGSSTHPPNGSATPLATPPSGSSTHPVTGSATSPATPPSGSAIPSKPAKPSKAQRKARRRRKAKQAILLVVLLALVGGAGTLWWAATHRTIPGHASATGSPTSGPNPTSRWEPTILEPCSAVERGRERPGANGNDRCQRTNTTDEPQHWVEEPPGGFPTSNADGPFPGEECTTIGDKEYSPVGDHVQCDGKTWQVIA
jgi:serine/threonine-protein kinase